MAGNPLEAMLRGLGILPEVQSATSFGGRVQDNPPAQLRPEDFIKEPPNMNWLERMLWKQTLPPVPQAALGPRG